MRRREAIAATGAALLFAGSAFAQERKARPGEVPYIVELRKRAALKVLEESPWIGFGRGRVVYALMSNLCPYCQVLYRRHPAAIRGLEMRYVALPILREESGEVARVWAERTPQAYHKYMAGGMKGIPPATFLKKDVAYPPKGADEIYTYYYIQIGVPGHLFKQVYPDRTFSGTPAFYVEVGEELGYFSGVSSLQQIVDLLT